MFEQVFVTSVLFAWFRCWSCQAERTSSRANMPLNYRHLRPSRSGGNGINEGNHENLLFLKAVVWIGQLSVCLSVRVGKIETFASEVNKVNRGYSLVKNVLVFKRLHVRGNWKKMSFYKGM